MTADVGDIFSARWIIEDAFHSHNDFALYVLDGRIGGLAPLAVLKSRYPSARVHLDTNTAILPGFVNAHHHCYGVNLINQGIRDDLLEPWIFASAGAADVAPRLATEYAAMRLLKNGVTAVVDACTAGQTAVLAEAKIRDKIAVYNGLGLSCAIAPGERWHNQLVHPYGQSQSFLTTLPEVLRCKLQRQHVARTRIEPQSFVRLLSRMHGEYAASECADVWFGPTAPHWTGRKTLRDIASKVRESGQRVHTHAEESRLQHISATAWCFQGAITELGKAGLLTDGLSLAHMVWADEKDLARVAEARAHIVCNPSSNLRLRSGIAPAPLMKRMGINLALGMDGTSLAGDDDMFAEMRLAQSLYWSSDRANPTLTAKDVFDMATMGGARLMGMDRSIGSLSVGKRADFVILRLDRLEGPWLDPGVDPVELLVSSAKSTDIHSVFTGGQLAVSHGETKKCDEKIILQNITDCMQRAADQRLSASEYAAVKSALQRWYDDWLTNNAPQL
ncbi:amidohydrolase family protein [Ruegeria sp. 2205SS24-7]|uniref:amidohydrolase family protein n=1 Tax=Ruegeria discodermiae TaxID=3064389 RepID=UPI00274158C4|nr:amidohydrolase family protein [Ruegeria sp. 2205SS24-7]MDP5218724.1 amidohydrolase family protein [Ruegeria sp. 2205SS24-7]